jgi:hypothetical protein
MSDKEIPFLAQTAILDRYIHLSDPLSDPVAVEVIINALKSKPDLRAYFFRSGPSSAWASILWRHGFFNSPPSPERSEQGSILPPWDVQYYLNSVASEVPDIVLKHAETISGHSWYVSQALKALCAIPTSESVKVIPRIIGWLDNSEMVDGISDEVISLTERFTKDNKLDQALMLFHALTAPDQLLDRKDSSAVWYQRSRRVDDRIFGTALEPSMCFEVLKKGRAPEVVEILENHLLTSLRIEAERANSPDHENLSWWRNAIEDSDQDNIDTYNDRILRALRDTLISWKNIDKEAIESTLVRYLSASQSILRRLGLYLLHQFPATYHDLVSIELLKRQNIDDVNIHHEYFLLLQKGYPYLALSEQQTLVSTILEGPDILKTQELAEWANKQYGADPEEYAIKHKNAWIRDRLWMIKEYLDSETSKNLSNLVSIGGAPEHPDFLAWSSGAFWVQEVSPFTDFELSKLTPNELIALLRDWQPDPLQRFGPEEISYSGLAKVVANLILNNLDKYTSFFSQIASIRPEFASEILERWINAKESPTITWQIVIDLCQALLSIDDIWIDKSVTFGNYYWRYVRFSIARLLKIGFKDQKRKLPPEFMTQGRDILIKLAFDPDPDAEADRPQEGYFGHNDPINIALNHVRPVAVSALIEAAWHHFMITKDLLGSEREADKSHLEAEVMRTLELKLDKVSEPSRAVHSIFGEYLIYLYQLDKRWVEKNLEHIFPSSTDDESIWYSVAAWNAYVICNRYRPDLIELLRPQYTQAINNISRGHLIKSYLDSTNHFAIHIAFEYLISDYDLDSPLGQSSLIVEFFNKTPPEVRHKAAWAVWRICEDNPSDLCHYWPRARRIWQWRSKEASISNHSPDFNEEMEEFTHLLLVAPETENLSTLRPLMEGLLPHIGRNEYRNLGWDLVEKYLSTQVEKDPDKAIQFYRLMYDRRTSRPHWFYHSDESRKIIEVAAENISSREDALSLIDLLSRWGDYEFITIHERYSH